MVQYNIKQCIVVRKDLNMRKGKMCAQVAHASMKFLIDLLKDLDPYEDDKLEYRLSKAEKTWLFDSKFAKIVVSVDSEQELLDLIEKSKSKGVKVCSIVDFGLTEFHGEKTLTCAAFGPDNKDKINEITGHLKIL